MGDYVRNRAAKRKPSSSTAGKVKGERCMRSQLKNQYAFDTKFCRDKNYASACAFVDNLNGVNRDKSISK